MISLLLIILPLLLIGVISIIDSVKIRCFVLYSYGFVQVLLAFYSYSMGMQHVPELDGIIRLNGLAGAFLVGFTGIQFVSLLAMPYQDSYKANQIGLLLVAFFSILTIVSSSNVIFAISFSLLLFTPFFYSLMKRDESGNTHLFFIIAMITALLVLLGGDYESNSSRSLNIPIFLAACLRIGLFPFHIWIRRIVMQLPIQWSILFFIAYPSVALFLPLDSTLPDSFYNEVLLHMAWISALYGGCLALTQNELRSTFYYLLLSLYGIIGVGLSLVSSMASVSGVLFYFMSSGLAFAGFGLSIELIESRIGTVRLFSHHGLIEQMPKLGILFLLFGLGSVGFPGMCVFIGEEVLLKEIYSHAGLVVVPILFTLSLNGVTVLRWFFSLFYGESTMKGGHFELLMREKFAFFILLAIIIGIGLYPQPLFELGESLR